MGADIRRNPDNRDRMHLRDARQQYDKRRVGEEVHQQQQQQPVHERQDSVDRMHQRQQTSSAGPAVRLSQHRDCAEDVHKYCKRSNLHNFAVVECLQDDLEVSTRYLASSSRCQSSLSCSIHTDI